jgi:hypothetical protein
MHVRVTVNIRKMLWWIQDVQSAWIKQLTMI